MAYSWDDYYKKHNNQMQQLEKDNTEQVEINRAKQEAEEKRKKRVTSAFDDGYQFGDITKTIGKVGYRIGENVVDSFKSSNAFKDGYQLGDLTKTYFGTAWNVRKSAAKGFLRASEGISDWGYNRLAKLADLVGADKQAQKWRDFADQDTTSGIGQDLNHIIAKDYSGSKSDAEVNSYVQNKFKNLDANSILSEKGQQYAEEIARMTTVALYGQYVAGAPVAGATGKAAKAVKALQNIGSSSIFYAGAASQAENEARAAGADPETAYKYGILSGSIEVLTENMFGGLGKISNVLGVSKGYADKLTSKFTSKIGSRLIKNLVEFGVDATGEGFEEWASGALGAWAKKLTYMKDADIKQLLEDEDLQEQFIEGMTLSMFMSSPNAVISTIQGRDLKTGFNTTQENLEKQLINERVEEESKTGKVSNKRYAEIKEEVHDNVAKGNVIGVEGLENAVKEGIVTPEEIEQSYTDKNVRDEIKKKVIGNNYVNNAINNGNYDTIVNGISKDLNATNTLNQYQSEISKRLSNNPEYQELFKQDPKKYGDLVTQEAVKRYVADQIDIKTKEIDAEFERYDLSDKDTQAMKNYFKDIVAKKNIRFVFEDNLTNKKGQTADGYITNAADGFTEIHLNRNSDRNMVYTTIHELYHLIKGTELEKALVQYAVNNTGSEQFETAKKALLESYNKNEINEEAAADMAAILLEDSNFVNYLYGDNSVNSKSFIKVVGDYVTKLLKNFTEKGRAENAQIKALENFKNLWVKNYNTQLNNLGKDTKYEVSAEGRSELAKRLVGQGEDWTNNNIVIKNKLPKALQNFDNTNSPSVIESHVYNNIYSKEEYDNFAQIKGWAVSKDNDGKNFHATGLSDYIEAINGMDDPLAVYQYTSSDKKHKSNEFIIVTKHQANIKNNKDGSNKLTKNGSEIKGNMVVAYQITDKSDIDSLPKVKGKPVPANIIKTVFASENAIDQYQAKVNKGEMIKIFQGEGKEVPYNERFEDLDGNLKAFENKKNEMSNVKKDSEGNTLSQGVRKSLVRVSPAMFNEKGELIVWHHTQYSPGAQYESFKSEHAEATKELLEGNRISFFTNDNITAKGYAQNKGDYAPAHSKITSIEQVQETIKNANLELEENVYRLEKNGKKYQLIREATPDENFLASLTAKERSKLINAWPGQSSIEYAIRNLMVNPLDMGLVSKIKENLNTLKNADPEGYERNLTAVKFLLQNRKKYGFENDDLGFKTGVVKEYENQKDLFRHFNHDITANEPLLQKSFKYDIYAYPEQVFEIDVDKTGAPGADNWFESIYKVDDSVKKTAWWKKVEKYRETVGINKEGTVEENYLNTEELASYILLIENPKRIKNGEPPYQAMALGNIVDPGGLKNATRKATDLVVFNDPRLMKSVTNRNPSNDPHMDYSISNKGTMWEQYLKTLKDNIPSSAKGKGINFVAKEHLKNKPAPVINKKSTKTDIKNNIASMSETIQNNTDLALPTSKVLSPGEIANLTPESAKSTPNLPNYKVKTGEGDSKITKSIKKSNFLSQETKDRLVADAQINSYQTTTNKAEIEEAIRRIDSGGAKETLDWFNKEKKFDGVDVAQGLMYLKLYEEAGDFENATRVTRKLHDITRQYGQAIQAMSMLSRMTPEGMAYHAQTELDEMFNRMIDGKSKEWIQEHRKEFDLTPEEVQSIMDLTRQAANETDDYQKRVAIAKIQKIVSDKLPSSLSNKAKSYFRISMLFNPKTQVRNIVGNALIAPVNWTSDLFASAIDKKLAQKSGYRTVSTFSLKDYSKGFKKGAYESYNDFKQDINTRNTDLNRYEQLQGKSFSDKNLLGKSLNGVERVLNFAMDGGDRIFYEGEFTNALNNIMATNNVETPTQDMIETAQNVALQRTWNDSNAYTKFVLNFRTSLNKAGGYIHLGNEQFGIGDILLPFAKTPANLTKAIVDYSPLGFLQAIGKKKALLNNIENGTATMQQQRAFVDTMGKAFAGTLLYIAAYGLAASGAATGESDEDKDVKDFLQNTLGVSSYSIKTPWGSFTYDWAQPIAAPLAIMTNAVNSVRSGDEKTGLKMIEAWLGSLNSASGVLMEQSFLQSFNDVMTNNDGIVTGTLQEISELPARAIPTFLSQINDMIDGTKRETYYKGHLLQSGWNYAKSKLPGVSQTLAPKRNTLGQEIKKYGGDNNIFNVFFNPANVNSQNMGKNAEEIYRIYEATGDKTVMPSVAPYSDTASGHIFTPEERSKYQEITGNIINDTIDYLLNYHDDGTGYDYESLSDSEKAVVLSKINSFAKQIARKEILGTDISDSYKNAYEYYQHGDLGAYYINTESANYALNYPAKYNVVTSAMDFKTYSKHSKAITELRANTTNDKEETIKYINNIPASDFSGGYDDIPVDVKRAMLLKTYYSSYHDYDSQIVNAVLTHVDMSSDKGKENAVAQLKKLGFKNVKIKGGYIYYD
ncbi:MAG: hypothetical protein II393_04090 [Cytophagales bacterium]|nr:hypothetical protein [Cytophagales bacterium]